MKKRIWEALHTPCTPQADALPLEPTPTEEEKILGQLYCPLSLSDEDESDNNENYEGRRGAIVARERSNCACGLVRAVR